MEKSVSAGWLRRGGLVAVVTSAVLAAGCGGGGGGGETASAPTSSIPSNAPSATIASPGASSANRAPVIEAKPATLISIGSSYELKPAVQDPDGDTLAFSVQNRPAWAQFNTVTGQLTGSPAAADIGTYGDVIITVSDGHTEVALPPFSITVSREEVLAGTGTRAPILQWTAPTETVDGAACGSLAGYRIHYGADESALSETIEIADASVLTYVIDALETGTYYIAVRALGADGTASPLSNVEKVVVM